MPMNTNFLGLRTARRVVTIPVIRSVSIYAAALSTPYGPTKDIDVFWRQGMTIFAVFSHSLIISHEPCNVKWYLYFKYSP